MRIGKLPIPTISLDVDLGGDHPEDAMVDPAAVGVALQRASLESAEMVKAAWIGIAIELGLNSDGDYINGIAVNGQISVSTPTMGTGDMMEATVTVTNTSQMASVVEDGHGAYSMVDRIRWGQTPKMKRTKDGTWYLTIPFRHSAYRSPAQMDTGGVTQRALRTMMPSPIYNQAKKLAPSRGLNAGKQYTASGQYRAADRYRWGGRLDTGNTRNVSGGTIAKPAMRNLDGRQTPEMTRVTVSRFQGMVKMSGGKGHTSYLTFRIITQKSKGWMMPAKAGYHIAAKLMQQIESGGLGRAISERVESVMRAAVMSGDITGGAL